MRTESVVIMTDNELDELVKKHFPNSNFEFVPNEECGNDSDHFFAVEEKTEERDEYDTWRWTKFEAGEWMPYITRDVLQELVNRDVLPPGNFLIRVSW